jgi:anti-anti-sigma factor
MTGTLPRKSDVRQISPKRPISLPGRDAVWYANCHVLAVQLFRLPVPGRGDDNRRSDIHPRPFEPPETGSGMAHPIRSHGEGWFGHGLTITIAKRDQARAGVRLVGELDLASVPILEACLENLLAVGTRYIRADVSGLSFIDCAGLGALLAAHHAFLQDRGTLVITGASGQTRRLMRIAGLDDVLFIAADAPQLAAISVA